MKIHNPPSMGTIPPKYAAIYSHAIETQLNGCRHLHISGQVGVPPSGELDAEFSGQLRQAMNNVETVLADANMTTKNIVKVTYYLTRRQDLDELVKIRSEVWHGVSPAVTVVVVAGLVNPDWYIEVDVTAQEESLG
jgi:enamine deaminase RidA (YjgF/YER057c/UK114 family)